jgi:hypothetical protein
MTAVVLAESPQYARNISAPLKATGLGREDLHGVSKVLVRVQLNEC